MELDVKIKNMKNKDNMKDFHLITTFCFCGEDKYAIKKHYRNARLVSYHIHDCEDNIVTGYAVEIVCINNTDKSSMMLDVLKFIKQHNREEYFELKDIDTGEIVLSGQDLVCYFI